MLGIFCHLVVYHVTDVLFGWAGFYRPKCSISLSSVYLCDETISHQLHDALTVTEVDLLSSEGERGQWSRGIDRKPVYEGAWTRSKASCSGGLFPLYIAADRLSCDFLCSNTLTNMLRPCCHRAVRIEVYWHEIYLKKKKHLSFLHTLHIFPCGGYYVIHDFTALVMQCVIGRSAAENWECLYGNM